MSTFDSESIDAKNKRKLREQIKVYFLTYFSYALIHIQREFWSLSKHKIAAQNADLPEDILGRFDTA